jgi:hypothetical protein
MQGRKDFEFNLRELAAIHCHRSQVNSSPVLSAPEEKQRLFLGTEHFRLAADRPSGMGKNVLKAWRGFIHEHSH